MKKIFKKIKLRDLIFFIIGGLIIGGIGITATTYILQANEIEYKNNKSVQEAIEELYTMAQNSGGNVETLPIGSVTVSGTQITIPYTGSYFATSCVYGVDENYGNEGTINSNNCTFSGSSNTTHYYKIVAVDSTGKVYENTGSKTTLSGPTIVTAGKPTGTVGVVYLGPTDLTKNCNASNSVSTTGTTSGCMKWYAFKEDANSYTMILDHNTYAKEASYSEVGSALETLKLQTGWKDLNTRMISGQELADITGNTSWVSSGVGDRYIYFDNNSTSQPSLGVGESKFYWLFDYTNNCTNYGCRVADSSTHGYCTSTYNSHYGAWYVLSSGSVYYTSLDKHDYGLRPVITVPKSNF